MPAKKVSTNVSLSNSDVKNVEIMLEQSDNELRESLSKIMVQGYEAKHAGLFFKGLDIYMERRVKDIIRQELATITPAKQTEEVNSLEDVAQKICEIIQNQLGLERTPAPDEQVSLHRENDRNAVINGLSFAFGAEIVGSIDTKMHGAPVIDDIATWIVQAQSGVV